MRHTPSWPEVDQKPRDRMISIVKHIFLIPLIYVVHVLVPLISPFIPGNYIKTPEHPNSNNVGDICIMKPTFIVQRLRKVVQSEAVLKRVRNHVMKFKPSIS